METARDAEFRIGQLSFDPRSGELRAPALARRLEPRAAAVLAALCETPGVVVNRQSLLDRCWGVGEGSDEALTSAVAQIRRTLDELGQSPDVVETLSKRGYRLKRTEGAVPAQTENLLGSQAPRAGRLTAILAVIAALLLVAWWLAPHNVRHAVRHGLWGGPPAAAQP